MFAVFQFTSCFDVCSQGLRRSNLKANNPLASNTLFPNRFLCQKQFQMVNLLAHGHRFRTEVMWRAHNETTMMCFVQKNLTPPQFVRFQQDWSDGSDSERHYVLDLFVKGIQKLTQNVQNAFAGFVNQAFGPGGPQSVPGSTDRLVKALTGTCSGPFRSLLSALGLRSNGQPKYLVLVAVEKCFHSDFV